MAITWDDILNDKDFKAYPTAKKVAVAIYFFKNYIAPYYKPEELPTVKTNFFKTLQEKPDKPSLMEGFVKPTVDATSQFITSTGRAFAVMAPAMAKFVADVPINTIEGMSKGQSFKESLRHGWYKASDEATELMDSSKYLVSPEAQQAAERINKLIGKAGAGYAGIAELIKTGDLQKAVNVIKDESGQEGSTAFVPAARVVGDVATFMSIFGAPRTARQFKTMTKAREMPQVKLERALSAKNLSERRAVLQEKPYGVEPISSEAPVGKTIPVPEIAGAAGGAQLTAKLSASDKVNLIRQSDTGRLLNVLEEARNQDIINKTDTTNAQKLVVRELVKRPDIADAIAKKLESGEKLDKLRTTLPDIISEPLLNKLKEMALPKEDATHKTVMTEHNKRAGEGSKGEHVTKEVQTMMDESVKKIQNKTPEEIEAQILARQAKPGTEKFVKTKYPELLKEKDTDLIAEARKYKTAEEFVKAQGEPLYHSTRTENIPSINQKGFTGDIGEMSGKTGGKMEKGVFLYGDKESADIFGKNFKDSSTVEVKVNGKIYDANSESKYGWEDDLQIQEIAKDKKIINQLRKDGYVGVNSVELGTPATFVFEPKTIKTKAQLTDIWNKAQEGGSGTPKGGTPEIKPSTPEDPLVAEARKYKTVEEFIAAQGEMQYHGSPVTFKEFKVENGRQFFTDNAEFAKGFSERSAKHYGEGANPSVTEAILDIQKPYIIDAKGDFAGNYQFGKKAEGYLKALKDDNYDSVIIKNTKDEGTVTIVKSKDQIKTKADLTSIWNKAQESKKTTPEERALIAEARKYKTVEKFIAAQGQTLFRASSKPFDIKLMQDDGIFLTPNKKYAEDWQKYQGYKNLEEFVIAPNAKILTQKDFPKKFIKEEGGYTFTSLDDQAAIIKYAKEKGFDGIEDYASKAGERTSHEFAIWNKDVIKTKAQLTDIWNKSNKPSKPVKPPAISFLGTQGFYEKVGKVVADIRKKITIPENLRGSMKTSLDSMIEHHRSIRHSEFLSKELTKAVNDVVKDPERQFLMTQAYEHQMKGKYWEQLNPTEKELVNYLSKEKAKLDQFIKDNDILEMKEMPQGVNHIFHHWIDPKTGKPFKATYGKFTKGLPQARQRTHMTFEEGMKNGLKPATVNLGELIGLEWEAAVRANSARELFKTLHGVKGDPDMTIVLRTGKPAKPIRMIERWDMLQKQGLSEDYVRYSSPFLDKALSFKNADGEIIVMKGAVGIQKELYPFVKAYIETPDYGNLSQLNFVSKSMKLGISMFHVVSLGMQELANFRMPFKNIPKGLRLKKDLTPELKILHQEGLELFKGYEDLGYRNQFFEGKTVVGKTGNIITYPVQKMRDFIFDVVQPGMKVSFADMQFRKLLPRYLKDAKETMTAEEVMRRVKNNEPIPEAAKQCAREVVQKADGHFSGEDYKRSLLETNKWMVNAYFTPKARKFWQALLLSPTWQREHLLVAKNVAKSFMPNSMIKKLGMSEMGAIKSQYRKYALGGIMIVGAVDLWNQMSTFAMDGERKHIWENPEGKGFAVRAWWDEPDYVIENEDGSERVVKGGAAYFRPLKSLFEVAEMAHDPITKFSYKISPVVSAIGEQFWHAPWKYKEGWGDIPERLKDFALTTTAPIIATQAVPVFKGQKHPMGAIMPSFGFPTSKVKADYKDEATVETKSIKNEFNKLRSAYFKTKDVKDYNAMVEFANTQEPKVRKQLEEKYKQEVILKDSPDRAFWKSAISARPKIVGKMMFDKMKKLPPEKQQEFNAMAHRLGLDTPKAIEEYNRLATEYMAKMQ